MRFLLRASVFLFVVCIQYSCFSGYITSGELSRRSDRLARKEQVWYIIKYNGDTITASKRDTKWKNIKNQSDIVEYQGRTEHAKLYNGKWLVQVKKGRMDLYFSAVPSGSSRVASYNSRTGGTTWSTVVHHEFDFYIQKGNGKIISILHNSQAFREVISDSDKCLKLFDGLKRNKKEEIRAKQYEKLLKIIDAYNR